MAENSIGQFCIKVRVGNVEIEVSAPDRDFVLHESDRLIEQFGLDATANLSDKIQTAHVNAAIPFGIGTNQNEYGKPETLGEFYKQFSPQTHLDKILVLGYWCEIKRGQQHFTSEDIIAKYKEIKEPPPANIRRDLGSLVSKGLLLSPEKSEDGTQAYALSRSGVKEVESKMAQS